ncbi:hypothetical protein G6F43_005424 [Rhizopus delemar]|nr:hypothetical protein G6F43_005424 [Rhizopus delemar]
MSLENKFDFKTLHFGCIILYNSYKPFHQGIPLKRMILDENAQYLIIAAYFLLSKRKIVTLLPFLVYSFFHVSDYLTSQLIPACMPQQTKLESTLKEIKSKYYEKAMILTCQYEICGILLPFVLGLFVFRTSVTCLLVYVHFLRMRYYMSSYTRDYLNSLFIQADTLLTPPTAHPKIPPAVIKTYSTLKDAWTASGHSSVDKKGK